VQVLRVITGNTHWEQMFSALPRNRTSLNAACISGSCQFRKSYTQRLTRRLTRDMIGQNAGEKTPVFYADEPHFLKKHG